MFSRNQPTAGSAAKPAKPATRALSFIGPEVVVSGDLATSAQLQVDGRIDGNVRCGQLCQGETGIIAGDILADEARVGGLVQGTVNAASVIVEASARITGDVTYETISIAAGARIDGRLARREALTQGAAAVLIATPTEPEPDVETKGGGLFAGEHGRIAIG